MKRKPAASGQGLRLDQAPMEPTPVRVVASAREAGGGSEGTDQRQVLPEPFAWLMLYRRTMF